MGNVGSWSASCHLGKEILGMNILKLNLVQQAHVFMVQVTFCIGIVLALPGTTSLACLHRWFMVGNFVD